MAPLDIFSLGRPPTEAEILAYIEELKIGARRYFPAFDPSLQYRLLDMTPWLSAVHEPPLGSLAGAGEEAYRFLWLRSFHFPICIRVTLGTGEPRIRTLVFESGGHGGPSDLRLAHERTLSPDEASTLRRELHRSSFWTTPTMGGSSGLDGACWSLEGAREGQHHIVRRWSPNDGGDETSFRALCMRMLMLSDAGDDQYPVY